MNINTTNPGIGTGLVQMGPTESAQPIDTEKPKLKSLFGGKSVTLGTVPAGEAEVVSAAVEASLNRFDAVGKLFSGAYAIKVAHGGPSEVK